MEGAKQAGRKWDRYGIAEEFGADFSSVVGTVESDIAV